MPLWHIYCPADAYTAPDKQALASAVTDLYAGEPSRLPRFYVSVVFQELPADCFFIGGEPRNNFVRIWINHIAVHMEGDTTRHDSFMRRMHAAIGPWVRDRGFEYEVHVDETPRGLWSVQGLKPPEWRSDEEKQWCQDNRPSALPDGATNF
jgi:phenylpyruvate tautomerase PptA (4-oxalocrotonate tautomerase family)